MPNNVIIWRGAVRPADVSPSGNEIRLWRGAVEIITYDLSGVSVESLSEVGAPILSMVWPPIRRLFNLTGVYDLSTELTGSDNAQDLTGEGN